MLALGAHPEREWHSQEVLTYHGGRDGPDYRLLLHQLLEGQVNKLAFVKPAGASWPLPLYDLALMTAAECAAHDRSDVELSLITPEQEPLGIFGQTASAAIRRLLEESGVALHTSSYGLPGRDGRLEITPGGQRLPVDRIVTEPRLVGPRMRGIPCEHDGFIPTDAHGRLAGLDDGRAGDDSVITEDVLWWPPDKIAGRYLAPYLSSQVGEALDVMPQDERAIPVETPLDPATVASQLSIDKLADVSPQ